MATRTGRRGGAVVSGAIVCCLLGSLAFIPVAAQTRASCDQWPAAERQAARERRLCIDRPLCTKVPPADRVQARETGACVDPVLPKDLPTLKLPGPFQPIPGGIIERPPPKDDVGPALIVIPDFVGQQQQVAYAMLGGQLRMHVVTRWQASLRPHGEVIGQVPSNTRVPPASTITLTVSDGSLVIVPQLKGLPLVTALSVLQSSSLQGQRVDQESRAPPESIIAQSPTAGSQARRGSTVQIFVAKVPPSVWVRSFIGTPFASAQRELASSRLQAQLQWRTSSAPRDQVVDQAPRETRVPVNSVVILGTSDGSLVVVPNLLGRPLPAAISVLQKSDLREQRVQEESRAPRGSIIAQSPAEGTEVRRGSTVRITVAEAPPNVWVRSFVGAPFEDAQRELTAARLRVRLQWRTSSAPRGEVMDQAPREAEVPVGTLVTLGASDGSMVRVPALRDMPLERARAELRERDLVAAVEEQVGAATPGRVLGQRPGPGSEVRRGATVVVTVATAPPMVWVPSVIGAPVDDARATLRDKHRLRSTAQSRASSEPRGIVVGQTPIEVRVVADSIVILQVSDGSLVRVPDLAALSEPAALALLRERDLNGAVTRQTSQAPPGMVFHQDVAADREVPRGSTVRVYVALAPPVPAPPKPPPTAPGGLPPWLWTLAAVPAAGAGALWLRGRLKNKAKAKAATRPDVAAQFAGPAEPPQAVAYEGPPLHLQIDITGPFPSAPPVADITQESRDE